jgi:cell division protein ZapA
MSQVSVTINGRQFRMACEDGQAGPLMNLARDLDVRIDGLRKKFGEIGDTRLTMMAALMVADEFAEVSQRLRRLEAEVATIQDSRVTAADRSRNTQAAIVAALNAAAERIESVTKKLNQTIGGDNIAMG